MAGTSFSRLSTANSYDNALRNLQTRQTALANLQENLTSGKRVVVASDDPTGAAQAERSLTRMSRIAADQRALEAQRNSITQAEGTLGRILQNGARSVRIQGEAFNVRARIRSLDLYSGHADGPELADWIKARLPLSHDLFLVHGEPAAVEGMAARLNGVIDAARILRPVLDEAFDLTASGAIRVAGAPHPRLPATKMARLDWHNDVSRLLLDINDALAASPDEKQRAVVIRRLRAALEPDDTQRHHKR